MSDTPSSSDSDAATQDPDQVADLASARGLIRGLQTLLATLHALIADLRTSLTELRTSLVAKDAEIAELRRTLLGPRSERQPRPQGSASKRPPLSEADKAKQLEAAQQKRAANRSKRKENLESVRVPHATPEVCPKCSGAGPFTALSPDLCQEIEFVEERLLRLIHVLDKKRCTCGHIFAAAAPARVTEGGLYGPALHAYIVVSKCADALPINRIATRLRRAGVAIARSTLTDIFHRTAELLAPIHRRLLAIVATSTYVNADETSQPVMAEGHCKNSFLWTFIANSIIAYVFSSDRSGETPLRILGETKGFLQVDGHTGYNAVCVPEGRERTGCLAHARRYFHKARDHCPAECEVAFEYIRKLYAVEIDAAERKILGTPAHHILRRERSKPVMDDLRAWLQQQQGVHDPKSPFGRAVGYTLNQWSRLIRFLDDPKLRLDNNISEGALRIIALGRDNFRWVGHDIAGENLAVLQTIIATCLRNDINPLHYIADVLMRLGTHPASAIDELLPMNWSPVSANHADEA